MRAELLVDESLPEEPSSPIAPSSVSLVELHATKANSEIAIRPILIVCMLFFVTL